MKNELLGRIQRQTASVNQVIAWGDHLSVEHPTIDAQHKGVFDLGAGVYDKWRSGASVDILRPALDKLGNLMHAHFAYEERVLADIGYPGLVAHQVEHRVMLDQLQTMHTYFSDFRDAQEIKRSSLQAPGWHMMQFILGFTIGHLMSSDMSYSLAIIANREGRAPENPATDGEALAEIKRLGVNNIFSSD